MVNVSRPVQPGARPGSLPRLSRPGGRGRLRVIWALLVASLGLAGCEVLDSSPYPGYLSLAEVATSVRREADGQVLIGRVSPVIDGTETELIVVLEQSADTEPKARFFGPELTNEFVLQSFQFGDPRTWLGLPDGRIWAGSRYIDPAEQRITPDEANIVLGDISVTAATDGGLAVFNLRLNRIPGRTELVAEPAALFLESGAIETATVTDPANLGPERILVEDLEQLALDSGFYPDGETFAFDASIAGGHGAITEGGAEVLHVYINLGDGDMLARLVVPMPFSGLPLVPATPYAADYFRIGRQVVEQSPRPVGDLVLFAHENDDLGPTVSVFDLSMPPDDPLTPLAPITERRVSDLFGFWIDDLEQLGELLALRPDGSAWYAWDPRSEMLFRLRPWWGAQ